ncbi:MAG TPA: hypothetical protein VFB80_16860 [Pirellulaceae bacterium]|nr:hypothetical protein [Pirellulaceae bacterium]
MASEQRLFTPVFSIDVSADHHAAAANTKIDANELIVGLLKQLVDGQQREIKLLEEIAHYVGLNHKQRQQEIANWKQANPDLARSCRIATEALAKVQNDLIHKLTEDAADNHESMVDSEFALAEFVDRFGPRMAHLGGMLHMVSTLSAQKEAPPAETAQEP